VSAQIQQLEASLGATLFHRSKRSSITLTDAGLLFLTEARNALRQVEIAESVGRLAGRGMLGHIEIGYVASANRKFESISLHRRVRCEPD
jgi:DNA-binding transcriptional LysR family regulator